MRKNTRVVFFLLVILILTACNNEVESIDASIKQGENQSEEIKSDASTEQSEVRDNKAKILKVNTDLEEKNNWHIVPEDVHSMTISAEVENVETILFWITPTGTGPWGERQLIGYDIDGSDGWSLQWEFGDRIFHDHITVQALGNDYATQARETFNVRSFDESMVE